MTERDEVRDQIAHAMGAQSRRLPADYFDEMDYWRALADAAMPIVNPIAQSRDAYRDERDATQRELDQARARKQADLDALKKRCGIQLRTIDAHITLRDELKAQLARAELAGGLATEQVEDLYAAAGLPYDEPFDDAAKKLRMLRWLHAEAVWQRDEARAKLQHAQTYAGNCAKHATVEVLRGDVAWHLRQIVTQPPHNCADASCSIQIDACGACCTCLGGCVYNGPES